MSDILFITHIHGFITPKNGGELRTSNIINALSKSHNVEVFCPYFRKQHGTVRAYSIITPWHIFWMQYLKATRGLTSITCALEKLLTRSHDSDVLRKNALQRIVNRRQYDYIFFDTLELFQPGTQLKSTNIWLIAHNVESVLNPKNKEVKILESHLHKYFHGVITCTIEDKVRFEKLSTGNNSLHYLIWPNGTAEIKIPQKLSEPTYDLIFVGSLSYGPNQEGLSWFFDQVVPELYKFRRGLKILIVGRAGPKWFMSKLMSSSATVITDVPEVTSWYFQSRVAVAPLLSGSGSRLKIPEAIMHGCPVISTTIGAEGGFSDFKNWVKIADNSQEFAYAVDQLLKISKFNRAEIQQNALPASWKNCINITELP